MVLAGVLVAGFAGCSNDASSPLPFEAPGPGVTFSFPLSGQLDVPVSSTILVAFSEVIDGTVLAGDCSISATGITTGGLCVVGGDGIVAGSARLVGHSSKAVEFVPESLEPGQTYTVYASPMLLAAGAGNIPVGDQLFQFTTRQDKIAVAETAFVVAINGDVPEVYSVASSTAPSFPLVDFATFRLVFSEPIDERTAILGESIEFLEVDGETEVPVAGQLLAQGIHMSFDPDEDLKPGATYQLRIKPEFLDLGGEALEAQVYEFQPGSSRADGELYAQVLDVASGIGDTDFPSISLLSNSEQNSVWITEDLIGDNAIHLNDGVIAAEMAHPDEFTHEVPIVIRKGQTLKASGLDVALAGVIPTGLSTGDVSITFVTDVTGILVRNSYRPQSVIPDNAESPLQVYLDFDVAVSSLDAIGNKVLTQTILGVRVAGLAEVIEGELFIHNLGVMELDILGIATGAAQLSLVFRSVIDKVVDVDTQAPTLMSTSPLVLAKVLEPGDSITMTFSEPMQLQDSDTVQLLSGAGTRLAADVRAQGTMVIVTPERPLGDDREFQVFLGPGLADLAGNAFEPSATGPTQGTGTWLFATAAVSTFRPTPPVIMSSYPGAPCSLVGDAPDSRRCVGGRGQDDPYVAFQMPPDSRVRVAFDKPMDPDSFVLGSACGEGAIRIEELSGDACSGVVPGTLFVRERGFEFVPASPWTTGTSYRMTLGSGENSTCNTDELCARNGLPLNPDPLNSSTDPGGQTIEVVFTGADADNGRLLELSSYPLVDRNGNGIVDLKEPEPDQNRAAVSLSQVSGVVTSASISMPDCDLDTAEVQGCMYLSSDLVVTLGEKQSSCSFDSAGSTVTADNCVPVVIAPTTIYGTELVMDANVFGLGLINNLSTGRMIMRVRETDGPVTGYIVEADDGKSELYVTMNIYLDAPDLSILGGAASHDLRSTELVIDLRGPITFLDDGRLQIHLLNVEPVDVLVGISTLGFNTGAMLLNIASGGMVVNYMSHATRGGQR